VTLARTIWLPDDGPRTETCWSVFNVLMCKVYKFYIFAVVGITIGRLKTKFKKNNFYQILCTPERELGAARFVFAIIPVRNWAHKSKKLNGVIPLTHSHTHHKI